MSIAIATTVKNPSIQSPCLAVNFSTALFLPLPSEKSCITTSHRNVASTPNRQLQIRF